MSYSYDPDVLTHSKGAPITDSIAIKVTDLGNASSDGTLDIAITDTAPQAKDDSSRIHNDSSSSMESGNAWTKAKDSAAGGRLETKPGTYVDT
mgnify:CR=1 FL=1